MGFLLLTQSRFRWVACQLDFLGDCLSDEACRDALGQLPPGLNESYMRILQRVPTGKEHTVQMILNFIAYAEPKLDIPILREALSVREKFGKDDVLNAQSIIREESITRLCRSLIRQSNDGHYFEFAHFSVQEFLEGEMESMPQFKAFQISHSICQILLAKQCLKYLLLRNFSSLPAEEPGLQAHIGMRIKQHPFYLYAAVCWPVFARIHWANESLVELALILFQPKKTGNFIAWALELACFSAMRCGGGNLEAARRPTALQGDRAKHILDLLPQVTDKTFTTLHMAATLSLSVICSNLIEQGMSIDQRSPFGRPLQCAVQGLFLTGLDENGSDNDSVGQIPELCCGASRWKANAISSRDGTDSGTDDTITLLCGAGATRITACSDPFEGETLITVALKLAYYWDKSIYAIGILLEAGYALDEEDLYQFSRFRQTVLHGTWPEDSHQGDDDFHLESLVLCLGAMIDRSDVHFRLCQAVWSLAIEMGCEFTRDPSITDTRISLSQDSLATAILTSTEIADTMALAEALKDPRADVKRLRDNDDGTLIFETWLSGLSTGGFSDNLRVLILLLSAGMEVNKPNEHGLLPIHELAQLSSSYYDSNCHDILGDVISEFVRKGTGCTARSRANQNTLHLGLGSTGFIQRVLELETDENILSAMRTQDEDGYTPVTLAIEDGREDVALILMEKSNYDLEILRGRGSIHALCVAGGTHRAFNILLDEGAGLDEADCSKTALLYQVGPKTNKDFVLQLTQMFPDGLRLRVDAKLPLDAYLNNCITSRTPMLDPGVIQLLAESGSEELDQDAKKQVWQNFTSSVRHASRQEETPNQMPIIWVRRENTSKAVDALLRLGFLQSYEAVSHASGILPLLECLWDDLHILSLTTICKILEQTTRWESIRKSVDVLKLLRVSIKDVDVDLVELLLKNGVSVHQRIDELSALEVACLSPAESLNAKRIFTTLLDYSDTCRLDEVNPFHEQGQALVHYLVGKQRQWQLEELLDRGADINIRTGIYFWSRPAVRHHICQGFPESAMILLARGADPTAADDSGLDTAMTAAFYGCVGILEHLYTCRGQFGQLDWQRVCTVSISHREGRQSTLTKVNALHLAAWGGHCDVLRFYVDKDLLTDPNVVSAELLTPIHLAAITGQVDMMKLLHSKGGNLNSKSADGSLPLHLAVRNEHTQVVKFLVESGSAIDTDIRGLSPVGYAMQLQDQSILDCLRTTKQYCEYQSVPGRLKMDLAYAYEQNLVRGDVKECEILRSQGCPVNVDLPGQNGRPALLLAIENSDAHEDDKEVIKWLLAHDADTTKQTLSEDGSLVSPLQAMIMRPVLNDVLPLLLQKYQNEGGSAVNERPSLVCIAIQHHNTPGLKILLDHIAQHETTRL